MPKFRKKAVEVEALYWDGSNTAEVADFMGCSPRFCSDAEGAWVEIDTLEGTMRADKGTWIVKGVNGEFYPYRSDIFATTYEAVQ